MSCFLGSVIIILDSMLTRFVPKMVLCGLIQTNNTFLDSEVPHKVKFYGFIF